MIALGIAEEDIQLNTQARMLGVAKDILVFSTAGKFDALIMGRRGLSGLGEVFIGSVSANVVDHSTDTPVWLVDEEGSSNDILVAVDGSENSLKAVDHLAFVTAKNTDVKISFFHVAPKLKDFCEIDFEDIQTEALKEIIRKGEKE